MVCENTGSAASGSKYHLQLISSDELYFVTTYFSASPTKLSGGLRVMAYTEAGFPVRHPIQTFFVISALRRNLSSSVVGMDDLFIEGRG